MKWIKYQVVQCTVDEENVFATKKIGYSNANLVIARNEAYNGQYEVIEDSKPEYVSGIIPTNLSDAVDSESNTNDGVAATPRAVKTAYDLANTASTVASSASSVASAANSTATSAKNTADAAMPKSGGTFTNKVYAQANTSYTTYQLRNIALSTSAATPTGNGSLLGVYS